MKTADRSEEEGEIVDQERRTGDGCYDLMYSSVWHCTLQYTVQYRIVPYINQLVTRGPREDEDDQKMEK